MKTDNWIRIEELSNSQIWDDAVCITIDIDWAHDDILSDTINLLEQYSVPVTWFVTHDTPLLHRLKDNPKFELGIHPNFNRKIDSSDDRTVNMIIDELISIVPNAKSVRSHSLLQSSRLLEIFKVYGLEFECNTIIPYQSNLELLPWRLWNGMLKVPHFWEDDVACLYGQMEGISALLKRKGVKVFSFHPIHIFLNTEDLDRYEVSKKFHHNAKRLIEYRASTYGARDALFELLASKEN
jgi:hypothetical protein